MELGLIVRSICSRNRGCLDWRGGGGKRVCKGQVIGMSLDNSRPDICCSVASGRPTNRISDSGQIYDTINGVPCTCYTLCLMARPHREEGFK
jgi:hypothetical protein